MAGWGLPPGAPGQLPLPPLGEVQAALTSPILDTAAANDAIKRIRHWFAAARSWHTGMAVVAANAPVQVVAADPLRIGLAIGLPAGMTAYIGPDRNVIGPTGTGGVVGMVLPNSGGWIFGPENPLAVWLISASAGSVTWLTLSGDV